MYVYAAKLKNNGRFSAIFMYYVFRSTSVKAWMYYFDLWLSVHFFIYLALKDETGSCKKTVKCSVGRDEELACKIVFFYAFMTEKLVVSDLYLRNTN